MAAHYGFDAIFFCNPASENEKGLVEGLVGFVRRNVCVPIPHAENIDELNSMLQAKCERYLQHQIRGKEATVGEMFAEEQERLRPLPGYPFAPAKRALARVDRFSIVRFETNCYSVPVEYCGKEVTVKALPEEIWIYSENEIIAKHQRCHGRDRSIYSLEHYLRLVACNQGYRVLFKNAATLSTELCEAKDQFRLSKLEKVLAKAHLLILDELSYCSFNRHQSELLFKVLPERNERSSTIVTTNLPFSRWTELFENETMVAALADRLTYRSHVLDMNGDSYRLKTTMQP